VQGLNLKIELMSENPFQLPDSFQEEYEPYICPFYDNWLIMSDIHIPYHNTPAVNELLNYGISKGITAILLNGDFLDCYMLSRFQPDPRMRSMNEELAAGREFLDCLQKYTGARIFFKLGNHEERLEKILITKAPEFLNVPDFELCTLLRLGEKKVECIKDKRIVYIGKLPILHGHEIGVKSAIVNPARSLFLKTYHSGMMSHLHVSSQHNEQSLNGTIISTWSTGHLGDPHPKYAPINRWNHGGARIEVGEDGDFEVINLRLIGNKVHRS
jgi:predicted phosphodiesterase